MSDQKLIIGYYRLSMEDDSEGESNSIINQRKLVKDYISNIPELVAMPFQEFYDDGYSGSSMERPAIKQVLELARENKVQCIVVKDFSRFARDEKSRTFSSNSKRSHILRTSSRSIRLILSSIVSLAVSLKCTRTI